MDKLTKILDHELEIWKLTSETGTPISCAIIPTIEKITKPEKIEVEQLAKLTRRASKNKQ